MSTHHEEQYLNLMMEILELGKSSDDRTGVGTKKLFGKMLRFDLAQGFPLITTKRVYWKGVSVELLWFISGDTNIRFLVRNGVNIWNEWPFRNWLHSEISPSILPGTEDWTREMKTFTHKIKHDEDFANRWGDLGPVYGKQWRDFNGFDQLAWVIEEIKNNPYSRRLIVSAWNAPLIEEMSVSGLPPCHYAFQFQVMEDKLNCLVNIRSWDVFLGGPFNIASYALLLSMVAQVTAYTPGELVISSADTHIYKNHREAVLTQIERRPYIFPTLILNPAIDDIDDFLLDHIEIENYQHHPAIKAPIAI